MLQCSIFLLQALLLCLIAVAAAAPEKDAYTLVDERTNLGEGHFFYKYETSNGISVQKTGTPGVEGQSNMHGSFRFTLPDGTIAEVRYIADENGYQPKISLIPTPRPLSALDFAFRAIVVEDRPSKNTAVIRSPV